MKCEYVASRGLVYRLQAPDIPLRDKAGGGGGGLKSMI